MRKHARILGDLPGPLRRSFEAWIASEPDPERLLAALEGGCWTRCSPLRFGEAWGLSPSDRGLLRDELALRVERAGGRIALAQVTLTLAEGRLKITLPWEDRS
jgi:hypothetical protein